MVPPNSDVDPVLRTSAQKEYRQRAVREFVASGFELGHCEEFYAAEEGRILGTEEFVDATIHRSAKRSEKVVARTMQRRHAEFRRMD